MLMTVLDNVHCAVHAHADVHRSITISFAGLQKGARTSRRFRQSANAATQAVQPGRQPMADKSFDTPTPVVPHPG